MYKNIERLKQTKGLKHFNFLPKTFILPSEYAEFSSTFNKVRGMYFLQEMYRVKVESFIRFLDCQACGIIQGKRNIFDKKSKPGKYLDICPAISLVLPHPFSCSIISHTASLMHFFTKSDSLDLTRGQGQDLVLASYPPTHLVTIFRFLHL